MIYTDEPKKAPVGTSFIEVCHVCGMDTGDILFKMKGRTDIEYRGPFRVTNKDSLCEFCKFLEGYVASQGKEEGRKYGAGKLVDEAGKLIAFVPFHDGETRIVKLEGVTEVNFQHGTVIQCRRGGQGFTLTKVLNPGQPDNTAGK